MTDTKPIARCLFTATAVVPAYGLTAQKVVMMAQYEPNDQRDDVQRFAEYTPEGDFQAVISNPALAGAFVPGRRYFIDITPAD